MVMIGKNWQPIITIFFSVTIVPDNIPPRLSAPVPTAFTVGF